MAPARSMATRAEVARANEERSRQRPRRHSTRRKKAERAAAEAVRHTSGHYAGGVTARRNVEADRGQHQTYDLEDSATGRPSRKSTRKAAHHVKTDAQLRRRAMRKASAPKERSSRG